MDHQAHYPQRFSEATNGTRLVISASEKQWITRLTVHYGTMNYVAVNVSALQTCICTGKVEYNFRCIENVLNNIFSIVAHLTVIQLK